MSTPDLGAIRARLAAATPGLWKCWDAWGPTRNGDTDGIMHVRRIGPEASGWVFLASGGGDIEGQRDDFELLIHAPADLAALCDRVERLERAIQFLGHNPEATLRRAAAYDAVVNTALAADPPTEGE